jgi:FAD/FMN-containing dehydrogenase
VIGVKGMWDAGERDAETFRQWIRHAGNRIRPFSTGRSYINFQTADEDEQRIQATYGTNFDRLTEIKKIYDPDNMFRVNRNITPSA